MVAPGDFIAKLSASGQSIELPFSVCPDPRIPIPIEDLKSKTTAALALRDLLSETNKMINDTESILRQMDELSKKLSTSDDKTTADQVSEAVKKVKEFRDEILRRPPPAMNYRSRPRLREEVQSLMFTVDDPVAKPTTQQTTRIKDLEKEVSDAKTILEKILTDDISRINERVKDLPQIVVGKPVKRDM